MKANRLAGHALAFEGAPHAVNETGALSRVGNSYGGVSGFGRGVCSCGEFSDLLDTAGERRRWHKAHKDAVRARNP